MFFLESDTKVFKCYFNNTRSICYTAPTVFEATFSAERALTAMALIAAAAAAPKPALKHSTSEGTAF